MKLHKIMCAVDFSEGSRQALRFATELARTSQAMLLLLHVADDDDPRLAAWKADAQRRGASEVAIRRRAGLAWEQIISVAADDPAIDVIVLGAHSRVPSDRPEIGSVAQLVVDQAPCAVMVVRDRAAISTTTDRASTV